MFSGHKSANLYPSGFVFRLMPMDRIAPWLGSGVGLRLLIFVCVVVAALVVAKIFFR